MKLHVDLSVHALPSHAVGRIYGVIDLPVIPRQGELIGFTFPNNGVLPISVPSFLQQIKVRHVLHSPQSLAEHVSLMLEPIVLDTVAEAKEVMRFLERGFGLHADVYLGDDA